MFRNVPNRAPFGRVCPEGFIYVAMSPPEMGGVTLPAARASYPLVRPVDLADLLEGVSSAVRIFGNITQP
jgi:hypothetical protein